MNKSNEFSAVSKGWGKWGRPEVPKSGWQCIGIDDSRGLGGGGDDYDGPRGPYGRHDGPNRGRGEGSSELDDICQMCERTPIRYLHKMIHHKWEGTLICGCICAGAMEENYVRAQKREKDYKSFQGKKKRWLMSTWKVSRKGNEYKNKHGFNVTVFRRGAMWGAIVSDRGNNRKTTISGFPTVSAAKLGSFDLLAKMQRWRAEWIKANPIVEPLDEFFLIRSGPADPSLSGGRAA